MEKNWINQLKLVHNDGMYCPDCGRTWKPGTNRCKHCGSKNVFEVDKALVPAIKLLRKLNFESTYSCIGEYDQYTVGDEKRFSACYIAFKFRSEDLEPWQYNTLELVHGILFKQASKRNFYYASVEAAGVGGWNYEYHIHTPHKDYAEFTIYINPQTDAIDSDVQINPDIAMINAVAVMPEIWTRVCRKRGMSINLTPIHFEPDEEGFPVDDWDRVHNPIHYNLKGGV